MLRRTHRRSTRLALLALKRVEHLERGRLAGPRPHKMHSIRRLSPALWEGVGVRGKISSTDVTTDHFGTFIPFFVKISRLYAFPPTVFSSIYPPIKCNIIGIPPNDRYIPSVQIPAIVSIFDANFCSLVLKNFNAGIAQKIKKNTKNINVIFPKPA